jgi:CheY-like chemotaxis protein
MFVISQSFVSSTSKRQDPHGRILRRGPMSTILVADDDEAVASTLSAVLARVYTVVTALSLEHVEQVVRGIRLDLVLLDVNFGREHSLDIARRIRHTGIGVLLISAAESTADLLLEHRCLEEDGVRVLAKTITPLELLLEVETALQWERQRWEVSTATKRPRLIVG